MCALPIYPTSEEIHWGHSGGGWIGEDAIGVLPLGTVKEEADGQFSSGGGTSVSQGGHSGVDYHAPTYETYDPVIDAAAKADAFTLGLNAKNANLTEWNKRHDTGARKPTDRNFVAKDVGNTGRSGEIVATAKVTPSTQPLTPNPQAVIPANIPLPGEGLVLDLSLTKIRDFNRSGVALSYLKDILHFNAAGDKLCLCSNLEIWDVAGEDPEKEFDFRYDADGAKWGAGTAWLK